MCWGLFDWYYTPRMTYLQCITLDLCRLSTDGHKQSRDEATANLYNAIMPA